MVKSILTQPDPKGRRDKWIAVPLEYDIEINPTKLIKGKGLAKMMIDSLCDSLQLIFLASQSNHLDTKVPMGPNFSISP